MSSSPTISKPTDLQRQAATELLYRRQKRVQVKESLYFFNNQVLGYTEMAESPHRLMCDSVQLGGLKQLHLWPRGHFKSSMITVGYVLWRIVQEPDIRVLITNATLSNAQSFLREIKGHIEHNIEFRRLYGDIKNKDEKWTEKEIIVSTRTKNLKEPTIQVAGVGQALASQHYDLIINDDLIDQDSINTLELIQKTKNWHALSQSLLEPEGTEIVVGTRYHYSDIYGSLIDSGDYNPQVHAATLDGDPIFPSRFTLEILASLRKAQGSYVYSCQYLNSPVDDETAKFKKSQMKYYTDGMLEGKELYTVYCVDRAYSLNKTADYTSHVVASVDLDNNLYVRLALRTRESEGLLINRLFDNKSYFKVDRCGIEQKAFKDTIKPNLDDEMRRRGDFFSVEELIGRSSKVSRIEALVPRFESGSIFLKEDMSELEDELLRFPSASHDDLSDGLAYTLDLIRKPSEKRIQRKPRFDSRTGRVLGYI